MQMQAARQLTLLVISFSSWMSSLRSGAGSGQQHGGGRLSMSEVRKEGSVRGEDSMQGRFITGVRRKDNKKMP